MMSKYWVVAVIFIAVTAGTGCDKINIPGNLAGQVLNEAGQGQGYLSVACVDVETGVEVQRLTAEDGGNFFFEKVEAGKYVVKTYAMSGRELANDCEPVALGAGRTESVIIYLIPEQE